MVRSQLNQTVSVDSTDNINCRSRNVLDNECFLSLIHLSESSVKVSPSVGTGSQTVGDVEHFVECSSELFSIVFRIVILCQQCLSLSSLHLTESHAGLSNEHVHISNHLFNLSDRSGLSNHSLSGGQHTLLNLSDYLSIHFVSSIQSSLPCIGIGNSSVQRINSISKYRRNSCTEVSQLEVIEDSPVITNSHILLDTYAESSVCYESYNLVISVQAFSKCTGCLSHIVRHITVSFNVCSAIYTFHTGIFQDAHYGNRIATSIEDSILHILIFCNNSIATSTIECLSRKFVVTIRQSCQILIYIEVSVPLLSSKVNVVVASVCRTSLPCCVAVSIITVEVLTNDEEGSVTRISFSSTIQSCNHLFLSNELPLCSSVSSISQVQSHNRSGTVITDVVHTIESDSKVLTSGNNLPVSHIRIHITVRAEEVLSTIGHVSVDSICTIAVSQSSIESVVNQRSLSTPRVTTVQELARSNVLHVVSTVSNYRRKFSSVVSQLEVVEDCPVIGNQNILLHTNAESTICYLYNQAVVSIQSGRECNTCSSHIVGNKAETCNICYGPTAHTIKHAITSLCIDV